MPTQLLPLGPATLMVQNVVYSMPAVKCTLFCDNTTPTIQQSNTLAFTNNVATVLVAGQATITSRFIRSTAGDITVALNRD